MDEAERLSDELLILREGRVMAAGPPRAVLGDLVGEHMLVLDARDPAARRSAPGRGRQVCRNPPGCLPPASGPGRTGSGPVQRPVRRSAVRGPPPTLDDLFLKLAEKTS
jgi:ABC-type multidrug transport system ATPase subunit